MPWLDFFLRKNPLISFFRTDAALRLTMRTSQLLQSRLASTQADQEDIVSHLLTYQNAHPGKLDPVGFFGHIMTNVVVGSDSTSVSLRACIYFLCRHPHTLLKLQNELDKNSTAISLAASSATPAIISWATAQDLPYLNAVIDECLRLHPPGSILSERVVPDGGLCVDNVEVPSGTIVGMNGWLTQRDPSVFGLDADSFRPERWLPEKGETEGDWKARVTQMRRATLVFGHGPRACIGRGVALLEIYKCIPTLVQAFNVRSTP